MNEKIIGELAFVITSAAALAFPLSLFLLWLYRRAVVQSMEIPRPSHRYRRTRRHAPSLGLSVIGVYYHRVEHLLRPQ